ncbi:hypothetical protein FACS189413_09840 [Bacteroidia bacterium]|nr:hypothetical protein FACS189413_09840 [Bacteroidia bacterium]
METHFASIFAVSIKKLNDMAKYFFITVFLMSLTIGSVFAEEKKKEKSDKDRLVLIGSLGMPNIAVDFAQYNY